MTNTPYDLRRNLGMSRHWLRSTLSRMDPASDPIAFVLDGGTQHGRALQEHLGIAGTHAAHEDWRTRAKLLAALRAIAPVVAVSLERAPGTDVGRWTVVYAGETVRVAVEGFKELGRHVLAPSLEGCIVGLNKCVDGGQHAWDAEVLYDEDAEADEDNTETACSKCGAAETMWSEMHGY